ncbi:hypothetical protein [Legionella fairfieldensis]|uniref:hypothetical protein n=1 Tax=Legionella fairfieldensis TaxID=45064 RepID=UPI00049170B8|nr:hypothetical protein [Legionella fairfieldensis]
MHKIIISLLCLAFLPLQSSCASVNTESIQQNNEFRNTVTSYVRHLAEHLVLHTPSPQLELLDTSWNNQYSHTYWSAIISIYYQGKKIGQGQTKNQSSLAKTIQQATEQALSHTTLPEITANELSTFRFHITFNYPPNSYYTFIEEGNKGVELLGNRAALRQMDTDSIKKQITASQYYLLGVMHPEIHGFFKRYDASRDERSDNLRTIYSASSLYSLLKLYQFNKDPELKKHFKPIAQFLLSMQIPDGENTGGFYYAYHVKTHKKTLRAVVGTASKTIFTLLELHRFSGEQLYLTAAKRAGDWLITMVKSDGRVTSEAIYSKDHWQYNHNQSFLYSGQVLSALSRLALVTKEPRYYKTASLIARRIVKETTRQNYFVGDDFRAPNTISTSWVTMALIDYAKVNKAPLYKDVINKAAAEILARQITNPEDAYNHGRYLDTMTTSGNGWINEVLSELYPFCKSQNRSGCTKYREAIILTSRWLLQNAYTTTNSYDLKNPSQAIGGFMRNFLSQSVRTDAVCHGVNSLVNLMTILGPDYQSLVTLAERPFAETIGLLRIGAAEPG